MGAPTVPDPVRDRLATGNHLEQSPDYLQDRQKGAEANLIRAADMLIARRADTRARADFATWKMMAKLNGASALPPEAQIFLESYKTLLQQMPEVAATEATIQLMY